MIKFTQNDVVDIELYEQRLRRDLRAYVDTDILKESVQKISIQMDSLEELATTIMSVDSSGYYNSLNRENIFYFLTEHMFVPEHMLARNGKMSVTKDRLNKILNKGKATEFLSTYLQYKDIYDLVVRIRSLYTKWTSSEGDVDNAGKPIDVVKMQVNQQQNLRYNYTEYNIVGVPKEYSSAITCPKGKMLIWGDFAQADFRIGYNLLVRGPENQRIMDKSEDKYEGLARIIADANNEPFDEVKFKEERKIFKTNTLGTMYGKRSADNPEEKEFVRKFSNYLETKCPKYMEYCKRIDDRIHLGLPINIESYFGNMMSIPLATSDYYAEGKGPREKALNTPFQTGTSEIIILTVNRILDMFYERGYTEDQIGVYFVRHDEPIFIADIEVMKDSWIFKECSDILVDDWTPLKADFYFGYNYTIADNILMSNYKTCIEMNNDKISVEIPSKPNNENFFPVKATMKLAVGKTQTSDGNTVVSFYDYDNRQASYLKVGTQDEEELLEEIEKRLAHHDSDFYKQGFGGVVILNSMIKKDVFYNYLYFNYKLQACTEVSTAQLLADYVAYKYEKRLGTSPTPSDSIVRNANLIATIKTFDLFGV